MLQRLSEDLEYYDLLDKAAKCQSSLEQMCYVAAFTVSSYSTTVHRTGKPFNPLLGETFELDRLKDCGYRSLCEQVCLPSSTLGPSAPRALSHIFPFRNFLSGESPPACRRPPRHLRERLEPQTRNHTGQQV